MQMCCKSVRAICRISCCVKALRKCGRPILLKRGCSSTVKELLMSADTSWHTEIQRDVMRARHSHIRNRYAQHLRHWAIPALNELTHLPIIFGSESCTESVAWYRH